MPLALGEASIVFAIILIIYGVFYLFARRSIAKSIKKINDNNKEIDRLINKMFKK